MRDSETKICQSCKTEFKIEPEDFAFYKKMKVPPPTFCPDCREQRRIAFRNERALYKRKCDLCGELVVSRLSPDKPYVMYCKKCWWSDSWDPLKYGREYDFARSFFEQFNELLHRTPHVSLLSSNTVNSDWVNQETDDKNCYLNVGGHYNEDSAYNTYAIRCNDVFDNYWLFQSQLCYESINCSRGYKVLYSHDCHDCREVYLSADCKNCSNCFGCAGLRNRQYCIWNKQLTKEAYESFMKDRPLSTLAKIKQNISQAEKVWCEVPSRARGIIQSVNSTGNYLNECKNVKHSFGADKMEDSVCIYIGAGAKDCYDLSSTGWGELMYEGSSSVGLANSKFFGFCMGGGSAETVASMNVEYCYAVISSKDCFGCSNIRNKQYCVLNKQYSETEYKDLVEKIKKQMLEIPYLDKKGRKYLYGEFFPNELSLFGYNETAANDHYPLGREEALERGFNWSDYEPETKYQFSDYIIPEDINDVGNDILEKVLKCETTGKAYRLIPMELEFYRKLDIPVPKKHPLTRHNERFAKLLPWKLFNRMCECNPEDTGKYRNTSSHVHGVKPCRSAISTPYSKESPELVYCEECYQMEVS